MKKKMFTEFKEEEVPKSKFHKEKHFKEDKRNDTGNFNRHLDAEADNNVNVDALKVKGKKDKHHVHL